MRLRTIEGVNKGAVVLYFDGNKSKTDILEGKVQPNSYAIQTFCSDAQKTEKIRTGKIITPWVMIRFVTDGITINKRPSSYTELFPKIGIVTKATAENFCDDFVLYKNGKEITFEDLSYTDDMIPKNLTKITPKFDADGKEVNTFDKKYLYFGAVGLALLYFLTRKK